MLIAEDVKWAIANIKYRSTGYSLYSDYYKGKHEIVFSSESYEELFCKIFKDFRENLCGTIVDTVNDKLVLQCVLPSPSPLDFSTIGDDQLQEYQPEEPDIRTRLTFEAIWKLNRLDALSIQVHKEALKNGDAYLFVWPDDNGFPRFHFNPASLVTVRYSEDSPGTIEMGAKVWKIQKRIRLNLYYPDRVEKYITTRESYDRIGIGEAQQINVTEFQPWTEDGDSGVVPNPWGIIPIFHFANGAEPGQFGISELKDVIPIQRALNKTIVDMLVGSEYQALPQRYALGIEVAIDPETGKMKPLFQTDTSRLWFSSNPDVKFGQFDGANIAQFVTVQDSFRMAASRVSAVPPHYFNFGTGGWPSGEALKTAETRLTAKTINRQVFFGNTWEDAFAFAGLIFLKKAMYCTSQWLNTSPQNEKEQAETSLLYKQIGVSNATLQERHNFDPDREKERKADEADTLVNDFASAFNRE